MRSAVTKFHPLTRQAAAVLLGEPSLGRDVGGRYLADRKRVRRGGRYYFLELLDATETGPVPTPRTVPVQVAAREPARGDGSPVVPAPAVRGVADHRGRASELNVAIRLGAQQLRVALFMSEPRAQEIAQLIKKGAPPAVILRVIAEVAREMQMNLQSTGVLNHVRIQAETMEAEAGMPSFLVRLLSDRLLPKLIDWTLARVGEYLRTKGSAFVTAAEDPKYGVTILVVFRNIRFLSTLRQAVSRKGISLGDFSLPDVVPSDVDVQLVAGFAQ
jgi:hypothetical protein